MELDEQYKRRLFRGYAAIAALPAVVFFMLGVVSVLISYAYAVREANLINNASLRHARDLLESVIAETDTVVLGMSTDPEFSTSAHRILGGRIDTYDDLLSRNIFFTTLNMAVNTRTFLRSLYVYVGGSSEYLAVSSAGIIPRADFPDTLWIDEWSSRRDQIGPLVASRIIHPLMNFPLTYRVLTVHRNMLFAGSFQYNGMITANIDVEFLERLISEDARRAGGLMQLCSADGSVVLEAGELTDRNPVRSEMPLGKYPLTLVSTSSRDVYYRLPRTLAFTSGIILVALLMGLLSAYVLSRRNFRSIAAVVDIIRAADNNQPLPQVDLSPRGGFHFLVYSILKTFVESRFLRIQLNEKELKQKALELLALQSQMNPHFLYNVLTTISFKTIQYTGGPNDATRMVDHLSKILEYSLSDPSLNPTVRDEIEHTKRYVAIQEFRYRGAFALDWDISDAALGCDCQRMMIQPLVENSIDHGLRGLDRSVRIVVGCTLHEGKVRIRVEDDGVGIGPEKLESLLAKIGAEKVESDCIGLVNTCRRIRLRYGEEGGYEIHSIPGGGTRITLEYPANAQLP